MARESSAGNDVFSWILRILAAGVLAMAAMNKLASSPDAIKMFETLGAEPVGRFGLGVVEALAALLLLVPRTKLVGAALAVVLMVGAIGAHATKLGWAVELADGTKDPGMTVMAFVLLGASLGLLVLHRAELPIIGSKPATPDD